MTKHQKNKLTKLLSQVCQARDNHQCIRCGKTTTLCASHIYPKGKYPHMRWELDNVKTLCYADHIHFFHKHPLAAAEWIKTAIPAKRLKKLKEMANRTGLKKIYKYEELKKELETKLKEYEERN